MNKFSKILWGNGLTATDEGNGVIRVDGVDGFPDPSAEPDGEWLMTSSGAAVWVPAAADLVPITDAGGYFSGTNVEAALQELGAGGGGGMTFGTPAIVLGTAAAAGSISEAIKRDATIVAFDATAPTTQAFGDAAATGSAAVAARRDHKHAMPATPTSVSGNAGTATALQTARAIDGQNFDGTAPITVIAPGTHAATGKTTPVDADELPLVDSAASNVLKKLTWANLKATLKTYFDTLYAATGSGVTSINKTGSTALTGAVTLTGGTNVTLTQSGQDISIAASGGGSGPKVYLSKPAGNITRAATSIGAFSTAWQIGSVVVASGQNVKLTMSASALGPGSNQNSLFAFFRDSTQIAAMIAESTYNNLTTTRHMTWVDENPGAGTYTYEIQAAQFTSGTLTVYQTNLTTNADGGSSIFVAEVYTP